MFTDSHTHLYLKEFDNDLEIVISDALKKKVNRFLLPNIDLHTLPELISVHKKYKDFVFPMIGLHPCSVSKTYLKDLEKLHNYIEKFPFIAIGEVGIDLYWETNMLNEQKIAFQTQINWAKIHKLPLIIHSRNSFDEIYTIMKQEDIGNITGIFHCFSGNYEQAMKIIDMGFYLGIGGVLTFKNSTIRDVIKKIDLKHLVLETDSPYLAPHPMRGKRNEPKFLPLVAEKLSEVKNVSIEEISATTNKNIDTIFF
ncbi:MAG: hydrolase TatD [Flavobacteriales bacterium]|nr:hydrolase TatD [Flavobacteriales bacterium]